MNLTVEYTDAEPNTIRYLGGDGEHIVFEMIGSSAELEHYSLETNIGVVREVASHVEQLPFVQAVTLDSEVDK